MWCWRRPLRVPWTTRRSIQSILKEIDPEYSLEGVMPNWSSNTLATWCEEPTHWKEPWGWERWKAKGAEGSRGRDDWMAPPTQWTWVWANSRRCWRTGEPGVLQFMESQRVRQLSNWATTTTKPYSAMGFTWSGDPMCFWLVLSPVLILCLMLRGYSVKVSWMNKSYTTLVTCHCVAKSYIIIEVAAESIRSAHSLLWGLKIRPTPWHRAQYPAVLPGQHRAAVCSLPLHDLSEFHFPLDLGVKREGWRLEKMRLLNAPQPPKIPSVIWLW